MKPLISISFFFCLLFTSAHAQESSRKFGDVSLKDFEFTYQDDPEAAAIVLFDKGLSEFEIVYDKGFQIIFSRQKRILIKTKNGIDHANISLPYYVDGQGQTEQIDNIQATTYYIENGGLQKKALQKKNIFSEKVSDQWYRKKFAFPNVSEGAIIEYRYNIRSPFIFKLPDWEYQSSIPTVYSEYIFKLIPFYEYVFMLQGTTQFAVYNAIKEKALPRHYAGVNFNDMMYTTAMKNIPAFKDESYITTKDDYLIKLDLQLAAINQPDGSKKEIITTYPKLIKALNNHYSFGKFLNKAEKISNNILSEINLSGKNDLEKCQIIIDYVKSNYQWNGQDRKYAKQRAKEVVEQKKGSSVEINLLLVALLKKAGIAAHPVIFSTRDNGKINKDYPFDHQFNSVVVYVEIGTKQLLTDATESLIPYNRIPVRCMNDQGLVIKEGDEIWVNMYSGIHSKNKYRITLSPDPKNFTAAVTVKNTMSEVEGYLSRYYYEDDKEKIKKRLADYQLEEVNNLTTEHFEEAEKNYAIQYEATIPIDNFDDKLVITPFLNFPQDENPLKHKSRTYPVDFIYKKSYNYACKINIPEGYQAIDLPKALTINDDLIKIVYALKIEGQSLQIFATVNYKQAIYQPNTYRKLKEHLDLIVEKFNEQIILEKG